MYARYFRTVPATPSRSLTQAPTGSGRWVRQLHRWVAIMFTVTVAANFAVMAFAAVPAWITYAPLPPLLLLMISGLTMFFRPKRQKNPMAQEDA